MADVITCPSGLTGRVRGMKVREERVLADRKLAKSGGQIDELLSACWEETLDAGPYALGEGGKRRGDAVEVTIEQAARGADLTSQDGIGDILACRALMRCFGGLAGQGGPQARHQRNRQRAGEGRFLGQFGGIDRDRGAELGDRFNRLGADQALGRLGARKLGLEGESMTQRGRVRERGQHR